MYHASDYYFGGKSPALYFFCAVPYGLTADELCSWIDFGGGQALWDEVDAQFNIKPLDGSQYRRADGRLVQQGDQPSGRLQGATLSDAGARRRGPAPHGRHGRDDRPAARSPTALKSGAIDASEWVGPWMDMELGLDKAAEYYYYPGFHEPGTNNTLGINKTLWEGLTASDVR